MKIVVLDGYAANPGDISWAEMEALGELVVYDRTAASETVERIGNAEAVLVNKVPIGADVMDACPGMKYIGVLATGYNIVDTQAAAERGIVVTNIPAYSTMSVAQLTMAFLLEICHHVGAHSESIRNGKWCESRDFVFWDYPLMELDGKTMGLIGFGSIGQQVARLAQAFGMEVLYYARHRKPEAETGHCRYADLPELLEKSDVVSMHCPQNADSAGMINRETIALMKDGAIFINTARGGLVVEADLAEALNSGKLYAAGIDVVSKEPMTPDNPLRTARNCMFTAHIAWAPYEARIRLMDLAVQNLKAFREGMPINQVN